MSYATDLRSIIRKNIFSLKEGNSALAEKNILFK